MKFTVIGAGNTGHAVTAYLADRGEEVTLYTRDAEKARLLAEGGITAYGSLAGSTVCLHPIPTACWPICTASCRPNCWKAA